MNFFVRFLFLTAAMLGAAAPSPVLAESILFESGTLGPTGIPQSDLNNGTVPGTNIKDVVFTGVRFHLDQPVVTSQVGGHFVANSVGTFFGAIVELDNENDFPDSFDFSTPDFVGSTLLDFPILSDEVYGDLSLPLDPGWYALVFGSGVFGATTNGVTVRNGTDIGSPSYIGFQPGSGFGWSDITSFAPNHRFFIRGQTVPEASVAALILMASMTLLLLNRPRTI